MITGLEVANRRAHCLDHPYPFVAQHRAFGDLGYVALEDVQIGATDSGVQNTDNGVGRLVDDRLGDVRPGFCTRSLIGERFHGGFP